MGSVASQGLLDELRARLRASGLFIAMPLDGASFDSASAAAGAPRLTELFAPARSAVVVGDGGATFFSSFLRAAEAAQARGQAAPPIDPLDAFTRACVSSVVEDVVTARGLKSRVMFPFGPDTPPLPFQRLGRAAGLPAPGPLGLQVHPEFGPWWAYRALVLLSCEVATWAHDAPDPSGAASSPCDACLRPCVEACPGHAVHATGFVFAACRDRRERAPACRESCAARLACPIGVPHRYDEAQLAFHMRASLAQIRRSPALTTT